jgi:hypothetical protein
MKRPDTFAQFVSKLAAAYGTEDRGTSRRGLGHALPGLHGVYDAQRALKRTALATREVALLAIVGERHT